MRETFSQQGKKVTAVALTAVLVAAPLGTMTLTERISAYGDEASTSSATYSAQWVEDTYTQAVVDAVARYSDGQTDSATLVAELNAALGEGQISQEDLDELLLIIKSGLLEGAPAWSDDDAAAGDAAGGDVPAAGDGVEGGAAGGDAAVPGEGVPGGSATAGGEGSGAAGSGEGAGNAGAASDGGTSGAGAALPGEGSAGTEGAEGAAGAAGVAGAAPSDADAEAPAGDADSNAVEAAEATGEPLPSSGEYMPHHYTQDLTTEKFIAVIGEQARQIAQENDLYASVMIAQAVLESASGQSLLSQAPNNNLFGIKGYWHGQCVSMTTWEENSEGHYHALRANFRQYDTLSDSLNDYADLLTTSMGNYYAGAWKSNAATPAAACDFLEGRYATASTYSESLQDIIATYDLTRFDEPLDYEPICAYELPVIDEKTGEVVLDETGRPVMESHDLADLLAEATSYLGTEYVWGGDTPDEGFDCSGLVQYCYQEALGVTLPRTTYFQWRVGETVDFNDLHPGDLLFFEEEGDVHHVALYLGDGCYIHAPQEGEEVKVTTMEEYMPSFAKRIVDTKPVAEQAADALPEQVKDDILQDGREKTQTALSSMIWSLVSSISRISLG